LGAHHDQGRCPPDQQQPANQGVNNDNAPEKTLSIYLVKNHQTMTAPQRINRSAEPDEKKS